VGYEFFRADDFVGDALLADSIGTDFTNREQRQKGRGRSGSRSRGWAGPRQVLRTRCACLRAPHRQARSGRGCRAVF